MADAKTWQTVRGQRPLNEGRVNTFKRLIEAELDLAELQGRRGQSQLREPENPAESEPENPPESDPGSG